LNDRLVNNWNLDCAPGIYVMVGTGSESREPAGAASEPVV
jgi:hypothetical protein